MDSLEQLQSLSRGLNKEANVVRPAPQELTLIAQREIQLQAEKKSRFNIKQAIATQG